MKQNANWETDRVLRPYASRVRRKMWLRRFGLWACVAAGVGVLLVALSFFVPIRHALGTALAVAGGICLVSGAVLALLPLRPEHLAAEIDRCGFQERVRTMMALEGDQSAFARLQRQDTVQALASADPKACVSTRTSPLPYGLAGAGVVLACLLSLIPSPQDSVLQEREEIRQVMQEQAQLVEESLELLQEDKTLEDERKAELNEKLRELAKELREGKDYKEGIKQISQLQQELGEIQKQEKKQQVSDLRSAFDKQSATKDLADKLEDKTVDQAMEEMEQAVRDALADEDKKSREDLAEALRKAAEAEDDTDTREALEDLAEAIEQGDQSAASEALDSLEDALDSGGGQGGGGMAQIGDELKLAKSRMGKLSQGEAFDGDADKLAEQFQQAQNDPNGDQSGNQSQQGSGQGQSGGGQQGQGTGGGNQGGAGGQGSGSGQQGQGSGQGGSGQGGSGGAGAGAGTGELVNSEKIYDTFRMDTEGYTTQIQGDINEEGPKQQAETDGGEGTLDGYIPYQQVVDEYAQDAVNAANREQLPPAVQDWVQGYFSALQD